MDTFTYREVTGEFEVEVCPVFVPERSVPYTTCYLYAYTVKINNHGPQSFQLLKRHWIIRDGQKKEERICGDGVVGERPIIPPNSFFQYTSFCPMPTPTGSMRGQYVLSGPSDHNVNIRIPVFFLRPPESFSCELR